MGAPSFFAERFDRAAQASVETDEATYASIADLLTCRDRAVRHAAEGRGRRRHVTNRDADMTCPSEFALPAPTTRRAPSVTAPHR